MTIVSFRPRTPTLEPPPPVTPIRAAWFERTSCPGLLEGGLLTCVSPFGMRREIKVALTWDVLHSLRAELEKHHAECSDDEIIRSVLRNWGLEEFKWRLKSGELLPAEGLVLRSLGGPCSSEAKHLLQDAGLLPYDAA